MDNLQNIPKNKFPKHIVIIPDGNRRWAKQGNKKNIQGHIKGAEKIIELLYFFQDIKEISIITLWGFSADNWKRNKDEINGLFSLIQNQIEKMTQKLQARNAKFVHLGRKDRIPKSLLHVIENAEKNTAHCSGQIICLAIDFGGEDQEIRMMKKAQLLPKDILITKKALWKLRDLQGLIPPADLLIRTAGEKRTSDIGWLNGASTELYFIDTYAPDITAEDIVNAIVDFSKRERRIGGNLNV